MFKNLSKQRLIGLLSGLFVPVLGVFIVLNARPELLGIQQMDENIVKVVNTQIVTLGLIINAGLFFAFLKFNKEEISQGILVTTVFYLILVVVYRFLL
jgi:Co/Zn/Cd efflux system component